MRSLASFKSSFSSKVNKSLGKIKLLVIPVKVELVSKFLFKSLDYALTKEELIFELFAIPK